MTATTAVDYKQMILLSAARTKTEQKKVSEQTKVETIVDMKRSNTMPSTG